MFPENKQLMEQKFQLSKPFKTPYEIKKTTSTNNVNTFSIPSSIDDDDCDCKPFTFPELIIAGANFLLKAILKLSF